MQYDEIYHHGTLGQRWGIIRTKAQLAAARLKTKMTKKPTDSKSEGAESGSNKPKGSSSSASNSQGKTESSSTSSASKDTSKPKKKRISEMTDKELKDTVARIKLEKEYIDYTSKPKDVRAVKAKEFVSSVLETSGKKVATQVATNLMGKMVNKVFDEEIVKIKN